MATCRSQSSGPARRRSSSPTSATPNTPGLYYDGAGNGTTTFTSASATFAPTDVGQQIIETDGKGLIAAGTTVASVVNTTTVILSTAAAKGTAVTFALPARAFPGAQFTNGTGNGTTTFTSATAEFTSNDLGQPLVETDGKGLIATGAIIVAVNSAASVTLSAAAGAATGIAFELPSRLDGLQSYHDGAGTTGSTTFTSATAAFNAGDVGRPIVETDGGSALAPGTVILTVMNSTTVTLSSKVLASASGVGFALPARNGSDVVLAGTPPSGIVDYASITLETAPAGTVILDVSPSYLVTLSSTDSRFTQAERATRAADPGRLSDHVHRRELEHSRRHRDHGHRLSAGTATSPRRRRSRFSVDKKSTASAYLGVNTNCDPLVIQVATPAPARSSQPSSGPDRRQVRQRRCTLPGAGASYTLRLSEAPPSGSAADRRDRAPTARRTRAGRRGHLPEHRQRRQVHRHRELQRHRGTLTLSASTARTRTG